MDRLGRVRIRFDFQTLPQGPGTSAASTWVRVLQRWAGAGMGAQFIPRIGQEVLVDFVDGNVERPLVVGALYNGRGEAGLAPTPGGQAAQDDASALAASGDHRPGAQGNLIGAGPGGHGPAWHGAGHASLQAAGQANAAALSGTKTQEFAGSGFNQLVFDDTDAQLRTQLATSQHATQLNLGHLIHQADNHRGSLRGLGFELRTDAYGAIRAGQGVLLSSYGTHAQEPAGDNVAGMALQGQLATLARTFSQAAGIHQTVKLAQAIGSRQAEASTLSEREPPAQALHTVLKGMVDETGFDAARADAAADSTSTEQGKLPHFTQPVVEVAAKAGLATVAGQDLQWSAGEGIVIASGQDTHLASAGASRIHTGQAIGILAGAIQPGEQATGTGITLIAGRGDVELQAQADRMQVAAKQDVTIQSQSTHIDWAAAKRIVLSTAGGASVTLEGGNITVECPGTITVHASQKSFEGADRISAPSVELPRSMMRFDEKFQLIDEVGDPIANMRIEIIRPDGTVVPAVSDAQGILPLQQGFDRTRLQIRVVGRISEGSKP
ncbi:DUF2345 domain-containing protein [Pseudorhodoferax sp.]|uniref:DUF2345 domain-containing protein n=1 Tax=Pseudorhodoferax sp. TaxID=1993553 RepID=UPI0039E37DDD